MAAHLPDAVRLAHEFKAGLLRGEEAHQFQMAQRYLQVEQRLQDRIVSLADRIALMRAQGQEVSLGKLYQLQHFHHTTMYFILFCFLYFQTVGDIVKYSHMRK